MISFWLLTTILLILCTPANCVLLLYFTSFGLFIHKIMLASLPSSLSYEILQYPFVALAHMYVFIGKWWHGYTIKGLENVPKTGPALLVFYHSPMPIDMYYFNASIITKCHRRTRYVGDRFLQKVPGFGALLEALHVAALSSNEMCQVLRENHLVCVSPGGLREALFSDDKYSLVWNNRVGFAKVWLDTCSVPIIPIFTMNGREAFRPVFANWFRGFYERVRLPVVPLIGGFPVKLTTVVGEPIKMPENIKRLKEENFDEAAKLVAETTAAGIKDLIEKNQRFPPSIWAALCDRFNSQQVQF